MAVSTPIRVLIADSHRLFAEALAMALEDRPDIDVLPEFPTSALKVERDVPRLKPDVLLLDYWIRGMEAPTLVGRILTGAPRQRIIVLCWFHSPGQVAAGLEAGAAGALHKAATVDEVAQAIRKVHRGEQMIYRQISAISDGDETSEAARPREDLATLTWKEVEILQMLAAGFSPQMISDRLSIKLSTTRTHINNILRKTETESALDAIAYGLRAGLIR